MPDPADALARRPELAAQASRLREFVEAAMARGEPVPSEAQELLTTLDHLVKALDELASTLGIE